MRKKIYVVGSGGFGREVLWLIERINQVHPTWKIEGIIDDNIEQYNKNINGYRVLGGCDYFDDIEEEVFIVIAIGSPKVREKIVKKLEEYPNIRFAKIIDPTVILSEKVEIGEGTIICAGTIITVNINIGKHVIINLDCTIGHDSILEDYTTVLPSVNLSGNTITQKYSTLGTGAKIIQGISIGSNVMVGAGSVIIRDIPSNCTVVGNPGKIIKGE